MRAGPLAIGCIIISAGVAIAEPPMAPNDIQANFFNGQPFTATALTGAKFKMTFTPDRKMTRQISLPIRQKKRRHVEAECEGLLHQLGTCEVELLHRRSRRRKQMVGSKDRNHHRSLSCGVVQVTCDKRVMTTAPRKVAVGQMLRRSLTNILGVRNCRRLMTRPLKRLFASQDFILDD